MCVGDGNKVQNTFSIMKDLFCWFFRKISPLKFFFEGSLTAQSGSISANRDICT